MLIDDRYYDYKNDGKYECVTLYKPPEHVIAVPNVVTMIAEHSIDKRKTPLCNPKDVDEIDYLAYYAKGIILPVLVTPKSNY